MNTKLLLGLCMIFILVLAGCQSTGQAIDQPDDSGDEIEQFSDRTALDTILDDIQNNPREITQEEISELANDLNELEQRNNNLLDMGYTQEQIDDNLLLYGGNYDDAIFAGPGALQSATVQGDTDLTSEQILERQQNLIDAGFTQEQITNYNLIDDEFYQEAFDLGPDEYISADISSTNNQEFSFEYESYLESENGDANVMDLANEAYGYDIDGDGKLTGSELESFENDLRSNGRTDELNTLTRIGTRSSTDASTTPTSTYSTSTRSDDDVREVANIMGVSEEEVRELSDEDFYSVLGKEPPQTTPDQPLQEGVVDSQGRVLLPDGSIGYIGTPLPSTSGSTTQQSGANLPYDNAEQVAYEQVFRANYKAKRMVGEDGVLLPGMRNAQNQVFFNGNWVDLVTVQTDQGPKTVYPTNIKSLQLGPEEFGSQGEFIDQILATSKEVKDEQSRTKPIAIIPRGTQSQQSIKSGLSADTRFPGVQFQDDGGIPIDAEFSASEASQIAKQFPREEYEYGTDSNGFFTITHRETKEYVTIQSAGKIDAKGSRISGGQIITFARDEGEGTLPIRINIVDAQGRTVGNGINIKDDLGENGWAFYGPDPEDPTKQKLYIQEKDENGNFVQMTGAQAEAYENKVAIRSEVQEWYTAASKAQSWSQLSSIFCSGSCVNDWAIEVDKIFHNAFLGGAEYWSEQICKTQADIGQGQDSTIYSLNEDGYLYPSGTITATKQMIETPTGTTYLYQVSYLLKNPEARQSQGFFGTPQSASRNTGVASRTAQSDQRRLNSQERQVWNEIKTAARTISSSQTKYSRTSQEVAYDYNIVFSGERTVTLLQEDAILENGDEIVNTKDDAFASYSDYNYNEVCIVFTGEKPLDAFYQEVPELCTQIADITDTNPTVLPQVEQRAQNNRDSGVFNRI